MTDEQVEELLETLERIATALEAKAPPTTLSGSAEKPRRYYGQESPQPESSNAEGTKRPKQASRS